MSWSCETCTFENPLTDHVCQACSTARSSPASTPTSSVVRSPRRHGRSNEQELYEQLLDPVRHARRTQARRNVQCFGVGAITGVIVGFSVGWATSPPSLGVLSALWSAIAGALGFGLLFGLFALRLGACCLPHPVGPAQLEASLLELPHRRNSRGSRGLGRHPALRGGHRSLSPQAAQLFQQMMELEAAEASTRPARQGHIAHLPTHRVTNEQLVGAPEECKSCTVCMEDFIPGEEQKTLPCFHRFHSACIDQWLRRQGTCPICKNRVDQAADLRVPPT